MSEPASKPRLGSTSRAALVIVLLVVAAAALPEGCALTRRTGAVRVLTPDLPPAAGYLVVGIGGLVLAAYVALRLTGAAGRGGRERKPLPVLVQIAIVLLALFLPALVFGPRRFLDRPETGVESVTQGNRGASPRLATERSRGLGVALTLLLGLLFLALAAGTAWLFWPERKSDGDPLPDAQALAEELAAGMEDLESIEDARAAVIACYARLETLLASAGVVPRPTDTPVELLERVLVELTDAKEGAATLTWLFERARFSDHEIDESMRVRALDAIRDIRDRIAVPV